MAFDLTSVNIALEAFTDIELKALTIAFSEVPQIAPGLLGFLPFDRAFSSAGFAPLAPSYLRTPGASIGSPCARHAR